MCRNTGGTTQLRDEPSPCPLTAFAGRVEDASHYTCAKSRSVLVSCRKVPLASQAPQKISTTPQFGCLAAAFLRPKAGVNVQKVGVTRASSSPSGINVVESDAIGPMKCPRILQIQARQAAKRRHQRPLLCCANLPEVDALLSCTDCALMKTSWFLALALLQSCSHQEGRSM